MKIQFIDRELLHFENIGWDEVIIRRKTIIEILSMPEVYRKLIEESE